MDMTKYEKGEWDMFEQITSAWAGKQRFYLDDSGVVFFTSEKVAQQCIDELGDEIKEAFEV